MIHLNTSCIILIHMPLIQLILTKDQDKILNLYKIIKEHSDKRQALASLIEVEGKRAIIDDHEDRNATGKY